MYAANPWEATAYDTDNYVDVAVAEADGLNNGVDAEGADDGFGDGGCGAGDDGADGDGGDQE